MLKRVTVLFATIAMLVGLSAAPAAADPNAPYGGKVRLSASSDVSKISVVCGDNVLKVMRSGQRSPCSDTNKVYIPKGCTSNISGRYGGLWWKIKNLQNVNLQVWC